MNLLVTHVLSGGTYNKSNTHHRRIDFRDCVPDGVHPTVVYNDSGMKRK